MKTIEQNPYEAFVEKHIEFDEHGRSKTVSAHGLAKLLKKFYKEIKKELEDESKAYLMELLDGFIMDLLVIGKTYSPEKQISEFAKKLKEERQKL